MARCIRCDKCGKIMNEVPIGEGNARKTLELKVITTYQEVKARKEIVSTRKITQDLCSDCCFGLVSTIFKNLEEE